MQAEHNSCGVDGCERQVIARGWCHMHYQRWHARNPVINFREAVYAENSRTGRTVIPLTRGMVTNVSPQDYEELKQYKWHITSTGYAARRVGKNGKIILMHQQLIAGEADHIDRDKLNNERKNLRACNRSMNNANKPKAIGSSSRFKGVCRILGTAKWQAGIQLRGKRYALGRFDDEEDAAIVYNVAAQLCFGEFATLNSV